MLVLPLLFSFSMFLAKASSNSSKKESCKSFMTFECTKLAKDKQADCVKAMLQKCDDLAHDKKSLAHDKAEAQSHASATPAPAEGGFQNITDSYKKFMGNFSSYMDSYKKFMGAGKGPTFQKFMNWQKFMGPASNSSGFQKFMDWQKYLGNGSVMKKFIDWHKFMPPASNSSGYQHYMDWQKFMNGTGKNSSYAKYMDWQSFMDWKKKTPTALSSKEHNDDSLEYTPEGTSLALLLCATGAFAAGFVFTREKLRPRRDSSTDYFIIV